MSEIHTKAKKTSFFPVKKLPLGGLYHMRNYSSDKNWLAYQVTLNQVRLIKYNEDLSIQQSFAFQVPTQPIKQIKILVDKNQDVAYLAVLFLTKYTIYKNNTQICSYRLKLDKNIVVFENSFVACDAYHDSQYLCFTFITANGEIHTVSADNPANKSINVLPSDSRFCTVKSLKQRTILGTENGKVILMSLLNNNLIKQFDTGSRMPVLHLKKMGQRIIAATCQGQIFNLSEDLNNFSSISVHQGLIVNLEILNQKLYTFGDDGFLNIFQLDNNSNELKLLRSQKYPKKANMLISINSQVFLNFYEDTALEQITFN